MCVSESSTSETRVSDHKIVNTDMSMGRFLILKCLISHILKSELSVSKENTLMFISYLHFYICWGLKGYIKSALKWQGMVDLKMTNEDVCLELLGCQSFWLTNFTIEISFKFPVYLTARWSSLCSLQFSVRMLFSIKSQRILPSWSWRFLLLSHLPLDHGPPRVFSWRWLTILSLTSTACFNSEY